MHDAYAYTIGNELYPDFAAAYAAWEAGGFDQDAPPVFRFGKRMPTNTELAEILREEGYGEAGHWQAGYLHGSFRLPAQAPADRSDRASYKGGYASGKRNPHVLRSHNMQWGFWGTWRQAWEAQGDEDSPYGGRVCAPALAWCCYFQRLAVTAPAFLMEEKREWLDSTRGRHRADQLLDRLAGGKDLTDALAAAA